MNKRQGRPMKYAHFLLVLEDSKIYSPATIVNYGEALGLFPKKLNGTALREARLKVRHALARLSSNHRFPDEGDGFVRMKGQAPIRGWKGKRWKTACNA